MKDKIVKFFNSIKNHAVKFLTKIKGHFVKHKQRYIRVLLVILCVYLVLLALCSIGRCTRKNVITADALGENTDSYFEVPVVMLYNSAVWEGPLEQAPSGSVFNSYTCVISNPIYLRLSRNLDFLGVTSITSDGAAEFIPRSSATLYDYDGVGCSYVVKRIYSNPNPVINFKSVDCRVRVQLVERMFGSYPAITQCNVIPQESSPGVFDKLRVELVNWSNNEGTVVCAFSITASVEGHAFTFLGYDVGYSVSVSDTYANGYVAGKEAGYNEGYSHGYANGSQTVGHENQFTALMNAIVFVPINALWNVINFEVLGVNVFMFVTAVITVLVVAWLWGKMK